MFKPSSNSSADNKETPKSPVVGNSSYKSHKHGGNNCDHIPHRAGRGHLALKQELHFKSVQMCKNTFYLGKPS